uniref:7TM GPCR serpentine receptor class x (Srx) domain-containing protein n=1 Tax=Panagrolaimus sp. PS1159 TaxID=55785 RepID=A0AC35GAE7_9BILA
MLITLWKGSFLSPKHGGTFLLAFGHILSGFVVTFLVTFYLGPAIIAQNTLFDTLFYPELIGVIFHAQWFEDMFLQLITGVNRIFLYYKTFTFSYLRSDYNAADYYVDLPINISCSFVAALCYFRIYLYVRNTNSQMLNVVSKAEAATRKNKEAKYAVQFAACTGFCIVAWICFRIIPLLIPENFMELYIIITLLTLCHCVSNSFVFFTFNPEANVF